MERVNEKLRAAAQYGDEAGLKALLLLPECDPMSKDKEGWTALIHAARAGREACVNLLLPVSDPLVQDEKGLTALMWAAANNGDPACVQLLLPVSDVCACDKRGISALMWAAVFGNAACVQFLLPASNMISKGIDEKLAGEHARVNGHHKLAALIEAYHLAMSEKSGLCTWAEGGVDQKSGKLRV